MSKKIVGKKTIKEKSSLRFEGIYENGYGLISKSFMKDKRLTIEAKSIYTYLCSYCGGGRTAYPSVALQCSDLCISENRYYKHRRLLEEYGYIKIEQQKEIVEYDDGTTKELFTNNIYTIVLNIDEEFKKKEAPPKKRVKSRIIKKVDSKKSNNSQTVDMTTSSPYLQFEGTKAVGMEDVSNNNNNINNNNFNNNNINISSSSKEEREEDNTFNKDLKTLMSFCNNVSYKLSKKKAKTILVAFALDKIMKAITTIISTVNLNNIKNYAAYLTATLKDMEAIKNITIENKIESITNNNNKPSNFANFTQRKYNYEKLEAQLLGWDTSDDAYEIDI